MLEMSGACETFNCLPRQGGMVDQDPMLIRQIMIVRSVQQEKRDRDMPKPKGK